MGESATTRLLASGGAFVDLSHWWKIAVTGADAFSWLGDLISADTDDLTPGRARRSLLLSPTGRIRAEFTVAASGESVLLLQDPIQPGRIDRILAPYVLSSNVILEDRTSELALLSIPGREAAPEAPGAVLSAPSCLGTGIDLIAQEKDHERLRRAVGRDLAEAGAGDVEAWRVIAGIARVGVDALEEDLPQEAGLAHAVSFAKGCYLGQEAVAKVQNLGHPRRLLIHLEAEGRVAAGDRVIVGGTDAGSISSAARWDGGTVALARVRWEAADGPFSTGSGVTLTPRSGI
jgi:tRNA-modifying protein YgfZ